MSESLPKPKNDVYGKLSVKYPVVWKALDELANSKADVREYVPVVNATPVTLKILIPTQEPTLAIPGVKTAVHNTAADAYSMTLDTVLQKTLECSVKEQMPFLVSSFKVLSRNIKKLLLIMEYLLSRGAMFVTANYFLQNGHVERRNKIIMAGHSLDDMNNNLASLEGLGPRHGFILKTFLQSEEELNR
jgi:hypothetical protein